MPVALNTYFPPNQPRPARCYALGRAIAEAVRDRLPGKARIGILASGGSSHFTVDEELDRPVLDACRRKDGAGDQLDPGQQGSIPEVRRSGTGSRSPARRSISTTHWQDYVPCYRSAAGTGCGMGFTVWS